MEQKRPETDTIAMVQTPIIGEPLGQPNQLTGEEITANNDNPEEVRALAERMNDYLVTVGELAAGCCIDGRHCIHTLAETTPQPGPSVAGGPSATAYAAAELVEDYFGDISAVSSLGRLEEVNQTLVSAGIVLGAHVSRGALDKTGRTFVSPETGLPETGCGASDKFIQIINQPGKNHDFVSDKTAQLLAESFNPSYMTFRDKSELQNRVKDYSSKDALDAVAVQASGANIEVLEGSHAEVLVVFNYVEGTTIDRDRLVAEAGKQVFVIDMWYVDKLARAMASGRPDADTMYPKLLHAMTAFQVGTYLTLCDGSHRPVILKPQEAAVTATR